MANSIEYFLGLVAGIVAGLALVVCLTWIIKKMGGKVGCGCQKGSYDERQMLARGQAYKTAFFTLMFYLIIISLISELFEMTLFMSFMGIWIGICFSIMVFAIICIIKDAYMSLYENAKGIIILFSVVALLNIIIGVRNIIEKCPMIEDGAISVDCMNLVVGAMFCIIVVVFGGKLIYDKKHVEEEE